MAGNPALLCGYFALQLSSPVISVGMDAGAPTDPGILRGLAFKLLAEQHMQLSIVCAETPFSLSVWIPKVFPPFMKQVSHRGYNTFYCINNHYVCRDGTAFSSCLKALLTAAYRF